MPVGLNKHQGKNCLSLYTVLPTLPLICPCTHTEKYFMWKRGNSPKRERCLRAHIWISRLGCIWLPRPDLPAICTSVVIYIKLFGVCQGASHGAWKCCLLVKDLSASPEAVLLQHCKCQGCRGSPPGCSLLWDTDLWEVLAKEIEAEKRTEEVGAGWSSPISLVPGK